MSLDSTGQQFQNRTGWKSYFFPIISEVSTGKTQAGGDFVTGKWNLLDICLLPYALVGYAINWTSAVESLPVAI